MVGMLAMILDDAEGRHQLANEAGIAVFLSVLQLPWLTTELETAVTGCLCNIASDASFDLGRGTLQTINGSSTHRGQPPEALLEVRKQRAFFSFLFILFSELVWSRTA